MHLFRTTANFFVRFQTEMLQRIAKALKSGKHLLLRSTFLLHFDFLFGNWKEFVWMIIFRKHLLRLRYLVQHCKRQWRTNGKFLSQKTRCQGFSLKSRRNSKDLELMTRRASFAFQVWISFPSLIFQRPQFVEKLRKQFHWKSAWAFKMLVPWIPCFGLMYFVTASFAGTQKVVSKIREELTKGNFDVDWGSSPHNVATVFKLYLRELHEPIIPAELYPICVGFGVSRNIAGTHPQCLASLLKFGSFSIPGQININLASRFLSLFDSRSFGRSEKSNGSS
jgi:hypothetical protein